jgi:hypothetical protein
VCVCDRCVDVARRHAEPAALNWGECSIGGTVTGKGNGLSW